MAIIFFTFFWSKPKNENTAEKNVLQLKACVKRLDDDDARKHSALSMLESQKKAEWFHKKLFDG